MDGGLALNLAVIAAQLTRRLIRFRQRMKYRETWLIDLLETADAHLNATQNIENRLCIETDGEESDRYHPWYPVAQNMQSMRLYLQALDKLLNDLKRMDDNDLWDRIMAQRRSDALRGLIQKLFDNIRDTFVLANVNLLLALIPSLKVPDSPRQRSSISTQGSGRLRTRTNSMATTVVEVEEMPIITACRQLDVNMVLELLRTDPELIKEETDRGWTLLDLVISQGARTDLAGGNQSHLVRLFVSAGIRFNLQRIETCRKTYEDIMQVIPLEDSLNRKKLKETTAGHEKAKKSSRKSSFGISFGKR